MKKIGKLFIKKYRELYNSVPFNELSTHQILNISNEISKLPNGSKSLELLFQPIHEPSKMTKTNIDIPILIGTTHNEGNLYISNDKDKFNELKFKTLLKHANIYNENLQYDTFQKQADIITEYYFKKPAYYLGENNKNCWIYDFHWKDVNQSIHILDLPFTFGHLDLLNKKESQLQKKKLIYP